MKPTWKQMVRFIIAGSLTGTWLFMFVMMGRSVVEAATVDGENLADLVTTYGTFLAIVGVLVATIVKDLFSTD